MPEKEKIILPPKYYLDYFNYLLEFIQKGSPHCLREEDLEFIDTYYNLSEDARCLMIRMANRKGEYFRLEKLIYEEIGNILAAAEELIEAEIATFDPPNDFLLFKLFTKSELDKLYPERELASKYKEDILLELAEGATSEEYDLIREQYAIIQFLQQEQIEYLKLLFFGHYHGMMTEFVIRDIGNVKLENLDNHKFTPWFDSQEEAVAVFELSKWNYTLKKAMQVLLPEEILELISPINWSNFLNQTKNRKTGDKLMLRLGEYFERTGYPEEALNYFALSRKHPARERRLRILDKLGRSEEAQEIAEVALESPYNATEQIFMKDYLSRKSRRNFRSTTAKIKDSPVIEISKTEGIKVEQLALEYYYKKGYNGLHAENYLWKGFFGLFFWDELFNHEQSSFHHPLQRMPSDLYNEKFYLNRKDALVQKTRSFRTRNQLLNHLQKVYDQKENISNPLVSWHESLFPGIEACVNSVPLIALKNVLLEIAKNVKDNSTGFPDLFIWKEGSYHFYEIKSPNDHLSAQQLFWIDFFNKHKIRADILRVQYI